MISNLKSILLQIKKRFPFLHYATLFHAIAFLFGVIAIFIDDRQLAGINVWVKPTKFLLSSAILLWTIGWYLLNFPFQEKTKNFIAIGLTVLLTFENILISFQAARGVASHYNESTLLDGMIFGSMGIAITLITIFMTWFFIKSFSQKLNFSPGMRWGFRIAWLAFLVGSAAGGSMIAQSAHNVGVADGGSGIPFLNWSTEGGDLRIAHFLGLHAIQIIPLGIYFFNKKIKSNSFTFISNISWAVVYLGWIVFTFYKAKMGETLF